ncbi:hypothetical protein EVAR_44420_1 [Eumeta japonica]|uniref:Uncharacterized protein n=1 Tax=Eumeta variegata TaxID=151549 RepID=A0A4C1XWB0_EUMVA|nr:hypothetical protein EVAR_44420_1 [Eumeta japonica]
MGGELRTGGELNLIGTESQAGPGPKRERNWGLRRMWGRDYNQMCDRLRNRKRSRCSVRKGEGIHFTSMLAQPRALVIRARTNKKGQNKVCRAG